jgi:23S rRNA (uridine2552-2'-O)-methyltransferase
LSFPAYSVTSHSSIRIFRSLHLAKSKSSRRWLDRHFRDEFVKRAQREGYRARAAYKLLEIQEKDHLLKRGMRVVDLGAAPGGWAQVAQEIVGDSGQVVGLDLLPIEPLPGVTFIQGDFRDNGSLEQLYAVLDGAPVDLVLSDMAPNVSGMPAVDQPRAIYLCELALEFCRETLKPGGSLVVKAFQGAGFEDYLRELRCAFKRVASRKPKASRSKSREVYLVAQGFKR